MQVPSVQNIYLLGDKDNLIPNPKNSKKKLIGLHDILLHSHNITLRETSENDVVTLSCQTRNNTFLVEVDSPGRSTKWEFTSRLVNMLTELPEFVHAPVRCRLTVKIDNVRVAQYVIVRSNTLFKSNLTGYTPFGKGRKGQKLTTSQKIAKLQEPTKKEFIKDITDFAHIYERYGADESLVVPMSID